MKVNFIIEDFGAFKYLGCATAAKNLYRGLSDKIDVRWNEKTYDFDIAHFHTFGPSSLLYAKRFKGVKIITAHSTPNLNIQNIALPFLVNWLYKPIYNRFDHIIAVSNKCRRELIEEMGIRKDVTTIYNGIDIENFKPDNGKRKTFRDRYKIKEDEILILTVAQRTPRKGIYGFLETAKRFPNLKFMWIGGFPYGGFSKEYLKIKRAIEKRSDNTIFPGFVEDITEAYSAADIFFMPSYAEGHSIVMLEALAMKLPVIARDLEEFREAFDDNLIYFKDIEDISEEMFDSKILEEYRGKSRIVEKFDIEKISVEHIKLYEKLI
ncbi:MAG: glycosyltransferase family 1 protein [Thermoplasmata archaeon]|nr:MAG: glycosyltransferase family 1 protein [Thermoplasmata archaeon]HEC89425.1 glycosyltransferase family 1 protein [Thermoplasmatales archaeon]